MKITQFRNTQIATASNAEGATTEALKSAANKVSQRMAIPEKNISDQFEKGSIPGGLGEKIPGLNKSDLPGGIGKNNDGWQGMLGGRGKEGLPGMPGKGKDIFGGMGPGSDGGLGEGLPGEDGLFGGMGKKGGPGLHMPGGDRMDGDSGGAIFGGGTWDFGPNGLHGSAHGGVTYGGYGLGVNDKGQVGVAKGDASGGSVTSPGDAQGAANSMVGGSGTKGSGVPEGLDWSRGTRVKDSSSNKDTGTTQEKKTEDYNDLGPSTNDPSTEEKKEDETAVAQNDTSQNSPAGKPNPDAMPNPEDSGGGSPRSNAARIGAYFMPNPEDTGGGSPRSRSSALGDLFMPNPDDSGGGTPRSVIANIAMKLRG